MDYIRQALSPVRYNDKCVACDSARALGHHQLGQATADIPQVTNIAVTSCHIISPIAMWLTELLTLLSPLIYMSFLTTKTFAEEDRGLQDSKANPMQHMAL